LCHGSREVALFPFLAEFMGIWGFSFFPSVELGGTPSLM
jgi:hypothetical protein